MRFISKRACRSFHDGASSACSTVPLATRWLTQDSACAFRLEHARQRLAAALADHDHDLALAWTGSCEAAINAVLLQIGGAYIAAEVGAVDFGLGAVVANLAALHFFGHRLTQLVSEHEADL